MASKKFEITEPQLMAMAELACEASSSLGCADDDLPTIRRLRLIKRMFKKNGYKLSILNDD